MTLENWNNILQLCLRSNVNAFYTIVYLISWVFLGNYVFLNLFIAILLDGFSSEKLEDLEKELLTELEDDELK